MLYRMNLMRLGTTTISQSSPKVWAPRLISSTPLLRSSRSSKTTTSSPKTALQTRTTNLAATLIAQMTISYFNRSMYSRIKECNRTETLPIRWSISNSRTICTDQLLWTSKVSYRTWTSRTSLTGSPSCSTSSSRLKCNNSSNSKLSTVRPILCNNNKCKGRVKR